MSADESHPSVPGQVTDVFISYSTKDKPTADAVCFKLEAEGFRCWIAPRDIMPGQEWAQSILGAIRGSKMMVLIFSSDSNSSKQVLREVELAIKNKKLLIPFRIEDTSPSGSMEYYLAVPHWLDAMTDPLDKHIQDLLVVVRKVAAQQAEPAGKQPATQEAAPPEPARHEAAKEPAIQEEPAPQAKAGKPMSYGIAIAAIVAVLAVAGFLFMGGNGKSGAKLWEFETGSAVHSSPAIGSDGTVYVGSEDNKLYAFKTDSEGLAKSPWPMRGQNAQHTGRALKK